MDECYACGGRFARPCPAVDFGGVVDVEKGFWYFISV